MPTPLMLIRNAESFNKTIRSELWREVNHSILDFNEAYPARRMHDPGLSERGRVQVKELASVVGPQLVEEEELERSLLITSPMLRALETALPLARRGQLPSDQHWCHPELFEIGSSFLHRQRRPSALAAELEADFELRCVEVPDDVDYPEREGGESDGHAAARVARTWTWLEGLLDSHAYTLIVVIAHGHLISRWLQRLGGVPHDSRLAFAHDHTGMTFVVWWEREGAVIERLNDTTHLFDGVSYARERGTRYLEPLG